MDRSVVSVRAKEIDDYINKHKDATLANKQEPFELNGQRQDLQVYRLPISLLVYNIRNGRFASQLKEREGELGRQLNPALENDAEEIERLLLQDKTKAEWLKADLLRVGQMRPGVITQDGAIIDGNRRVTVMRHLSEAQGHSRFSFIEVVRLPIDVSPADIWRIEAGIQLSTDLKASYGPVNELFKIREGLNLKLKAKEIAVVLGGDNTEKDVKEKIERLKLIEDYLVSVGHPFKYSEAERKVEHFIDLQKIMKRKEWKNLKTTSKTRVLRAAYILIQVGIAHLRIRDLGKIVKDEETLAEFLDEIESNAGTPNKTPAKNQDMPVKSVKEEIETLKEAIAVGGNEESDTDQMEDNEDDEEPPTQKLRTTRKDTYGDTLSDAVDKADARAQKKKPGQLLKKAMASLESLVKFDKTSLKSITRDIDKLSRLIDEIKKKAGD